MKETRRDSDIWSGDSEHLAPDHIDSIDISLPSSSAALESFPSLSENVPLTYRYTLAAGLDNI